MLKKFQKSLGGKLLIYANKPYGITKSLLTAKNMSNPVDVQSCELQRGFYKMGERHLHVSKKPKVTIRMEYFPLGGPCLITIGM
jgi:hypothetical protein